jgi:hypothetical protein
MRLTAVFLTTILLLGILLLPAAVRPAVGDMYVLAGGGRVVGKLLNADEKPRTKYVIKTASGGQVTLQKSQVKQILHSRAELIEYEEIRPSYPDTAEGQWALAQWCLENKLSSQRKKHLRRVIELQPDHAKARRILGYSLVGGKWTTQEERMTSQGFILHKGKWISAQEIELLEKNRNNKLVERGWFQKIKRWRKWLGTKKDQQARKNLLEIDDPYAVKALVQGLTKDNVPEFRILYIEALANLGTSQALRALGVCSIEDPVEEVRLTCLDYLEKKKPPAAIEYYAGKLRSKDNRVVNRAGNSLGRLDAKTAIVPLINSLVTKHKYKVTTGKPGGMTTTFPTGDSSRGGGLSMGGKTKVVTRHLNNQSVLDALVKITGVNYQYDQRAWKNWYASQKNTEGFDARRD